MKLSGVTILTVLVLLAISVAFKDKGNELFTKIDKYLSELEEAGNSGQVLVEVDGEIYRRGFGLADREREVPFTPETITGTGSITKQFTGAAILKLEEQGKLKTGDPISKYFPNVPADKRQITLHHLLTHSAGFPGAIGDDYVEISTKEFVDLALKEPLQFTPGTAYDYSNVGYTLLAIIVEKQSGMTYEKYLNKELFIPAGMQNTGYILPDFSDNELAIGYRKENRWGKLNEKNWGEEGPYWHLKGNGGILSNSEDMYKWHQALEGDKILSQAAKAKYYGKHIKEGQGGESYYGYGWSIVPTPRGTDLITHNGGNGVFMADFLRYPKEDVTIWYATNAVNREVRDTGWEIARMIFQPEYQARLKVITENGPLTMEDEKVKNAFLMMLEKEDDESIVEFVSTQFSPGMIKVVPMAEHLNLLGNIRNDLRGIAFKKSVRMQDEMIMKFSEEDRELDVILNVEGGKVVGLGVDN